MFYPYHYHIKGNLIICNYCEASAVFDRARNTSPVHVEGCPNIGGVIDTKRAYATVKGVITYTMDAPLNEDGTAVRI